MKVLWFVNTAAKYDKGDVYNGGGWITSLQDYVESHQEIELAICFRLNCNDFKVSKGNSIYYPVSTIRRSKFHTFFTICFKGINTFCKYLDTEYLKEYEKVIDDFKPDIIHVFGSEKNFGLIAGYTQIPVILHLQGILNPCFNAFLPASFSYWDYLFQDLNALKILKRWVSYKTFEYGAQRELHILQKVKYFMGRTNWDNHISRVLSPNSCYFHCDEIIRNSFYNSCIEKRNKDLFVSSNRIVTTISSPLYKGLDLVLKTASVLKYMGVDFEWFVVGIEDSMYVERHIGINHKEVNISYLGILDESQLANELSHAVIYVHSSYIDNSPNSICEAQLMGLPVVSTNVGGISSLVKSGETGFLVPANDPYEAAYAINMLLNNRELCLKMSRSALESARVRHNPNAVFNRVYDIYNEICN